jgi:hypothetical protein
METPKTILEAIGERLVSSCQRFDLKFDRMTGGMFTHPELRKPIGWMTWGCVISYIIAYVHYGFSIVYQIIPFNRWVPLTLLFVSFALGIAALTRKDTNRIVGAILLIMFFGPIFL